MDAYTTACSIKEYLVNLGIEGKFPSDLNQLNECDLEKIINESNKENRKSWGFSFADIEGLVSRMNDERLLLGDNQINYSKELANKVMDYLDKTGDADYGVSWITIEHAIEECIR